MSLNRRALGRLCGLLAGVFSPEGHAAPVDVNLLAQPAAQALIAFSQQARVEVLFAYDDLQAATARPLVGRFEPEDALVRLLKDTGFAARRKSPGRFVVGPIARPTGAVRGQLLHSDGQPAANVTITLPGTSLATRSDGHGEFVLAGLSPGRHAVVVTGEGVQPVRIEHVEIEAGQLAWLPTQRLEKASPVERLEPFIVQGRSVRLRPLDDSAALLGPRRATGNLDLPRTIDDALPYTLYTREQITRSGVVALNEFLQRAVLEGSATTQPPEQSGSFRLEDGLAGSANLRLRGYTENETVILINGRRLPEIQTSVTQTQPADVNFVPLSLIQQVEVLPASASALYTGNPVGGVINIVLRPDVTATEVTATYTNTTAGYDAPQTSVALQHGQSLLGGRLRLRFNAVAARAEPPTESELGLRADQVARSPLPADPLYRATPNVRSADGTPLFGLGSPTFTSVAPGANGPGGLNAFAGRAGVRSTALFDSPGGMSASLVSADSPFGRRQRRTTYFGSVTYEPRPWLQLGIDATHSGTVLNRGLDVLSADLTLGATSPLNPFGQEVAVALNETAPLLGDDYSEARIDFSSGVAGVLLRLPADWRVSLDAQYARNVVKYRGLAGVDLDRWQELVDTRRYNPLRDTQTAPPPAEFYDRALVFRGARGAFVTLGNYNTLDAAARLSNQSLALPAGQGALIAGVDYRRQQLRDYQEQFVYADGAPADVPSNRVGRTLERYSFFGELQAPLLPARWLPRGLWHLEGDLAARYVASAQSNETNVAPTFGVKADFLGGIAFRASVTTSNRFPTPQLSREIGDRPAGPGGGVNQETINDPVRHESYAVAIDEIVNAALPPEDAVTQTAGLIIARGRDRRFRASLDFVDTRKTNEILFLGSTELLNVEALFPNRVERGPLTPGDQQPVGRITRLRTGSVNASWRRSQNWTAALTYAWVDCAGGTLEIRSRLLYYQRYERQVFANSPVVDQLDHPDGTTPLLRYRADFNVNWSNRRFGCGVDGQYFHSRILPLPERAAQHADRIKPYGQVDAYAQADLSPWVPWLSPHGGLRAQLRVNNLSGFNYPKYVNDDAGSGVQPYGDWRGRTYSLSLTATF